MGGFPLPIFLFIFGLTIGSFLNVLSLRYEGDGNIFLGAHGRSHCPHCRQTLRWYELIPVFSFLVQGGHCRSCQQKISWQYPLVELLTGFIFLFPLHWYTPFFPHLYYILSSALWVAVLTLFVLITVVDFRLSIIPDELNLALAGVGLALTGLAYYFHQFGLYAGSFIGGPAVLFGLRNNIWINHLFAALVASAGLLLIILLSKGRAMGMGDVKLFAALGLVFGWPDILFVMGFAFIIGALWGLYLIFGRKMGMKDAVPFGPFVVLGALALIFWGAQIIETYFRFFNII